MKFSVHKAYMPKVFKLGQIAKTIRSFLQNYDVDCESISYSLYYKENSIEWNDTVQFKDLYQINDFSRNLCSLIFRFDIKENSHDFYVSFQNQSGVFYLGFGAPSLEDAKENLELFERELGLCEYVKESKQSINIKEELQRINDKLIDLEQKVNQGNENLKCFISYRFNDRIEKYISELKRFLKMVGIDVITGSDYEPRRISEKVTDKLKMDYDFIIYVVTKEGESTWCRDELGASYGRDYTIIPILEEGCELENGILSDWEYINFRPDHIGDIYVKLLEGINYIKKQKRSSLDK